MVSPLLKSIDESELSTHTHWYANHKPYCAITIKMIIDVFTLR